MFKKYFLQALVSGILAALAANIYDRIYFFATEADFSQVLSVTRIISLCFLFCFSAAFLDWFLVLKLKRKGEVIFNFLFSIASFALIIIPISVSLPLDIKFPELFPGLAVPMAFFPAISWYTVVPLFRKDPVGKTQ
jgi:hypothetical protein